MDKEKLIEITNDVENKSNNDLLNTLLNLETEFDKTKDLIISLTRHLDIVTEMYEKVNTEIKKRHKK